MADGVAEPSLAIFVTCSCPSAFPATNVRPSCDQLPGEQYRFADEKVATTSVPHAV